MADATQDNRIASLDVKALEKDTLLLRTATISEQLARPFHIELDLLSSQPAIDFSKIVGKPVTIQLDVPDGDSTRYFNGYVSRFSQTGEAGDYYGYRASVVPWLWLLTRSADCAIFQDATVPDIIKQIFGKYAFADFDDSGLEKTYPKREYCVQYRETDFNFVSRLMESEGIYYFFRHSDGGHTLVLCDASSSHDENPDYGTIRYHTPSPGEASSETIREWTVEQELQTGKYVLKDFDFKDPSKTLLVSQDMERPNDHADLEVFDYPGDYAQPHSPTADIDSKHYAQVRIEELQTHFEVAHGTSDSFGVATGCHFTLSEHPHDEWNTKYLVTATDYHVQSDEFISRARATSSSNGVSCRFTAIDAKSSFRPARLTPKPVVQGPQTAIVCGKSGTEIWTDKYARVRVHFFWDRKGPQDERSSCWIRVAQIWAGVNWGGIHIPRIGQEVIVEFLEGDPDRPIITGRVYNNNQMPPYDLPSNMTRSGIKSRSSKGGGPANFNEIRMEDKKGSEQLYLHAEKNMDVCVENDDKERIYGNHHHIVGWQKDGAKGGDQHEMVYQDKHLKVHRNQIEQIGGSIKLLVGGIDGGPGDQDIVLKGTKKELIEMDDHLHVKGARNEKVDGDQSLTIGGNQQEKVGSNHALDAGQQIHLKAGMTVVIEAGMQLTLKGPGGFVDIGPAGVTIQGTMVMINSGGSGGSGNGSNPTAPTDADQAAPVEPAVADNS